MKSGLMTLILLLSTELAQAASLQDLYRSGGVRLIPDPQFAVGADWQQLFSDYSDRVGSKQIGSRKQMVVAPDGSIFVSNYSQYTIYKFSPSGKLLKTFGRKGRRPGEFRRGPSLGRIVDGRYLPINDDFGRISLFDLEGNYVKSLILDWSPDAPLGLVNDQIALAGFVVGRPNKHVIALKDIKTGREIQLRSVVQPTTGRLNVRCPGGRGMLGISTSSVHVNALLAATREGNLVAGFSSSPEITVYAPSGRMIGHFDLQIQPIPVSQKAKDEFYESARATFAKNRLPEAGLAAIREPGFFPPHLPYYYNLLVDSEDNILIFPYTEDEKPRRFQVYTLDGRLACESALDPGDFELNLNPGQRLIQFAGQSLFSLLPLREATGVPLRLFRVDLKAQQKR